MDDRYVDLVRGEGLKRCDGVHELLSWLMSRRIPFTLASSGPRRKVIFSLESADIAWAFPDFVCGDDVMRTKPAPDLYLSAASILRVPPVNCLAIEDAPAGVQAALSAGMQVVAVTTSFDEKTLLGASLVIKSLRLLLEQWTTSEALTSPCSPDTF
jgi:HAD superfamily hydrolase (TIGR01509 family)